jgi:uncharacterized protein (DUF2267 family)
MITEEEAAHNRWIASVNTLGHQVRRGDHYRAARARLRQLRRRFRGNDAPAARAAIAMTELEVAMFAPMPDPNDPPQGIQGAELAVSPPHLRVYPRSEPAP